MRTLSIKICVRVRHPVSLKVRHAQWMPFTNLRFAAWLTLPIQIPVVRQLPDVSYSQRLEGSKKTINA